nr:MAG TPA: hypothetical protein [Caudoviricetes sp.]
MKSKIIALVAVAILLWLVLSVSISLLLAVTALCIKIMGAPAAIACFVASILFVIFCSLLCSEEKGEDEKK